MESDNMKSEYMPQLSEIQRKVLIVLAENGPLSGYDFHLGGKRKRGSRKAIMVNSYWLKVRKRLGPEGFNLIREVELRGRPKSGSRRKNLFWLTDKGLIYVLTEGVNSRKLLTQTKKVYGKSIQSLLIELANVLGPKAFRLASGLIAQKSLSEQTLMGVMNTATLYAATFTNKKPKVLVKQITAILKDYSDIYPELYELYKQALRRAKQEMISLSSIVEKEGVMSE